MALSGQTGYIVPQGIYHVGPGGGTKHISTQLNNERIQYTKKIINTLWPGLCTDNLPWLGVLRGVFLANHLASTENLTRTTKRQKLIIHISLA